MWRIEHGDCLDVMAGMDAGSVDAVVTDPPYGLSFMGKHWDHGLPGVDFWTEALRIAKPSTYLLAFGGTRTSHRLTCAIEDAGWQIRDCLMWLYGSGFPKGKSCLKPAWEPIILARKPGPMRELGIDCCRIGTNGESMSYSSSSSIGVTRFGTGTTEQHPSGRWPANLILDEEAGRGLDASTGVVRAAGEYQRGDVSCTGFGDWHTDGGPTYADSGGPSRFYYCAKASRSERNKGLEGMEAEYEHSGPRGHERNGDGSPRPRPRPRGNVHPTVKPVALMSWLVKLVARPGDVVLDPFTGSGTTGVACVTEGRDFIGIEREAEYVQIASRRIRHYACCAPESGSNDGSTQIKESDSVPQMTMF